MTPPAKRQHETWTTPTCYTSARACTARTPQAEQPALRYTWASWHAQAGTPMHVLQELGGWETHGMVRRYAHLSPGHLAEHAERIARPAGAVVVTFPAQRRSAQGS